MQFIIQQKILEAIRDLEFSLEKLFEIKDFDNQAMVKAGRIERERLQNRKNEITSICETLKEQVKRLEKLV